MKSQTVSMVDQQKILEAVEKTIEKAFEKYQTQRHPKYVSPQAAMEILGVRVSKLQTLRNNFEIRYSMTSNRGIMYEYQSLIDYLDRNVVK